MDGIVGRLERVDLGAGGFALSTRDDGRFLLVGAVPSEWVGRLVRVRGRASQAAGFLMTGDPSIEVASIELAD